LPRRGPTMPRFTMTVTARHVTVEARRTCRCSGCCATCSASPDRSTAAASASAGPAPATSTARRIHPA
jgi:hypothetical protein